MTDFGKLIPLINACTDRAKLRNWIANAEREKANNVADAARRRLIALDDSANADDLSDPLILDFWKSIAALEFALSNERGKTVRLARTRQKIARVGVQKTLLDLAIKTMSSEGFTLLRDRNMLDLAAEAVVLRFPDRFDPAVLQAAKLRLAR